MFVVIAIETLRYELRNCDARKDRGKRLAGDPILPTELVFVTELSSEGQVALTANLLE